jgi:predicted MFS family arabinose efflux permease
MTFPSGLRALNHRDFRIVFAAQSVALVGMWMQQVAQAWLVLQLTNSPLKLGLIGTLNFAPALMFSLVAGAVADRVPKRRLLVLTQSVMAVQALTLGSLIVTGHIAYWHVCAMGLLWGVANTLDLPTRQSFVLELVGRTDLANAVAMNAAAFKAARVVGPAAAGLLIAAVGVAPAFFINGVSFLLAIPALLTVRTRGLSLRRGGTTIGDEVREGVRYALRTPRIVIVLSILGVVGITVFNFSVYVPLLARDVLGRGPDGLGFLMASLGVGAVAGALSLAMVGDRSPSVSLLFVTGFVSCGGLLVMSVVRHFGVAVVALFVLGFTSIIVVAGCNATLQLTAPDELRGRVMSLHTFVFGGVFPIGVFFVGAVSEQWGVPTAFAVGGVIGLLGLCVILLFWRRTSLR